jgi:hypothetical protein
LKNSILKPKTISALYRSYSDDLVVDTGMTIDKMIQFVGVVRKVTASEIRTYQVEATGKIVGGADVLIWHKDSKNMLAILDIFKGLAPLADAPEQQFEDTTTTSTLPHTTTTTKSSVPASATSVAKPGSEQTSTSVATGDTAPLSNAPKSAIVPDPAQEC